MGLVGHLLISTTKYVPVHTFLSFGSWLADFWLHVSTKLYELVSRELEAGELQEVRENVTFSGRSRTHREQPNQYVMVKSVLWIDSFSDQLEVNLF